MHYFLCFRKGGLYSAISFQHSLCFRFDLQDQYVFHIIISSFFRYLIFEYKFGALEIGWCESVDFNF